MKAIGILFLRMEFIRCCLPILRRLIDPVMIGFGLVIRCLTNPAKNPGFLLMLVEFSHISILQRILDDDKLSYGF